MFTLFIIFIAKCEAMNITDYLNKHDLISISSIERKLNLTKGTLRKDKDVPEKLVQQITDLLSDYGLNSIAQCDKSIAQCDKEVISPIAVCETVDTVCEVTKNTAQFKLKSIAGTIRLFDRIELPIGTKYSFKILE
jgi:hypothetical protein